MSDDAPQEEEKPKKKPKKEDEDQHEAYKKLPRYTVGLAKKTDENCYVDFFETNSLTQAKEKAEEKAKKEMWPVAVWDRHGFPSMAYKVDPRPKVIEAPKKEEEKPKRKGKIR